MTSEPPTSTGTRSPGGPSGHSGDWNSVLCWAVPVKCTVDCISLDHQHRNRTDFSPTPVRQPWCWCCKPAGNAGTWPLQLRREHLGHWVTLFPHRASARARTPSFVRTAASHSQLAGRGTAAGADQCLINVAQLVILSDNYPQTV